MSWPVRVDRRLDEDQLVEDRRLLRQCLGKVGYADRGEAERARLFRPQHVRDLLSTYICRLCGLWHMGHTS